MAKRGKWLAKKGERWVAKEGDGVAYCSREMGG